MDMGRSVLDASAIKTVGKHLPDLILHRAVTTPS